MLKMKLACVASFTFELGVLSGIEAGNGEPAERRARDSGALGDVPPRLWLTLPTV